MDQRQFTVTGFHHHPLSSMCKSNICSFHLDAVGFATLQQFSKVTRKREGGIENTINEEYNEFSAAWHCMYENLKKSVTFSRRQTTCECVFSYGCISHFLRR